MRKDVNLLAALACIAALSSCGPSKSNADQKPRRDHVRPIAG